MALELQCRDEVWRCIEDVLRISAAVKAQQQGDQSRHNGRVTDGPKLESPVSFVSDKPDLGLTTANAILLAAKLFRKLGQSAAQVDQVLVAVHPVVEQGEFIDNFLLSDLYFVSHVSTATPPGRSFAAILDGDAGFFEFVPYRIGKFEIATGFGSVTSFNQRLNFVSR